MDGQKSFSLYNRKRFTNVSHYDQPKEIGSYFLDINRQISYDKSQLRYLVNSKNREAHNVHFDLMHGFERRSFKDFDFNERLDNILRWVLKHRDIFANGTKSPQTLATKRTTDKLSTLNADFVIKRGCLTKILCSPYSTSTPWKLAVIRFNNTFYLCEIESEWGYSELSEILSHSGWKFEQYLTTDKPNGEADTSIPINNCEAYYTIMKTNLNSHSLILSGEIDCMDDSDGKYIELKTKKESVNPKHKENFKRFILLKYWAQSFLLGVPRIICGFHQGNVVQRLQEFNTKDIPDMVKDINNPWDPNICVDFLDQFLTFIKKTITVNDHRKVYVFKREPKATSITCQLIEEDTEFHFLPQWYIDEFKN